MFVILANPIGFPDVTSSKNAHCQNGVSLLISETAGKCEEFTFVARLGRGDIQKIE